MKDIFIQKNKTDMNGTVPNGQYEYLSLLKLAVQCQYQLYINCNVYWSSKVKKIVWMRRLKGLVTEYLYVFLIAVMLRLYYLKKNKSKAA